MLLLLNAKCLEEKEVAETKQSLKEILILRTVEQNTDADKLTAIFLVNRWMSVRGALQSQGQAMRRVPNYGWQWSNAGPLKNS